MKIYEHNVETGNAVEREMTAAELAQFNLDKADAETKAEAEIKAKNARDAAKTKLTALGLTLDDLTALGL